MLHLLDSGTIALIDNEDIADLHDAGFESLDVVTHARHENHDRHVSEFHNIDFILPDSHGFNEDRMTCDMVLPSVGSEAFSLLQM